MLQLHRRENKLITGSRWMEVTGREKEGEGKKEGTGLGIGKDRRQVLRVRKSKKNM